MECAEFWLGLIAEKANCSRVQKIPGNRFFCRRISATIDEHATNKGKGSNQKGDSNKACPPT